MPLQACAKKVRSEPRLQSNGADWVFSIGTRNGSVGAAKDWADRMFSEM